MWFEEAERFHVDELAALVTEETGSELHIVLAPEPVWRSEETRPGNDISRGTRHRDEPTPAEVAKLLSAPEEARYGWSSDLINDVHLRTLVASCDQFGLVAVRENDDVFVRTFWRDHLSAVLAAVLPNKSWKIPKAPISVLRGEILAARSETIGAPRPSRQVARAEALAALKPYAIAEFSAEIRDRDGHRRITPCPLRVYENDEGLWTLIARPRYGDELLEFAPADLDDVATRLDELRRELN
ncbi:MAG TPA: ESX secretion-associated protein EspG [Amycolatopsis sp.]|uniref:ESX secretion-associated protein EspG n=1 Tax=Amycolatopsis sp. TaxID=37632 RepID=UPI002B489BD8|nr:ESX secretion-associated protein EspG [Amycolatopsis sp.]HKS47887.1 ESX secretion-associated protein EspG [Amycolatopsis sp.]